MTRPPQPFLGPPLTRQGRTGTFQPSRTPGQAPVRPASGSGPCGRERMEERPPDVATSLHRLRRAYPNWAFLYDAAHGNWIALRGRGAGAPTLVQPNPISLRAALEAAGASHQP